MASRQKSKASGMPAAATFTCAFHPMISASDSWSCGTLWTFPETSFAFELGVTTTLWFGVGRSHASHLTRRCSQLAKAFGVAYLFLVRRQSTRAAMEREARRRGIDRRRWRPKSRAEQ